MKYLKPKSAEGSYRQEWSPRSKKSGSNLPPDKRPGDGDPLLLPARQLRALAPDVGVVPIKVGGMSQLTG